MTPNKCTCTFALYFSIANAQTTSLLVTGYTVNLLNNKFHAHTSVFCFVLEHTNTYTLNITQMIKYIQYTSARTI